jgi:hypothetical protein
MRGMKAAHVIALTVAVATSTATSARAAGGTYVVESCRTARGPASSQSWVARPVPADAKLSSRLFTDGCAVGGDVRFELQPLIDHEAYAGQWLFEAPAGTSIVGLDLWRFAAVLAPEQPARYRLFADEQVLERSPDLPTWEIGAFGAGGLVSAGGLDARRVGVEIGCEEGDPRCAGDAIHLGVSRAAVSLRDDVPPEAVGSPSGRLFTGLSIDGLVDARLGFRDTGGGVAGVELKVDGVTYGIADAGGPTCEPPYVARVPCALTGSATLTLDTARLSDGARGSVRHLGADSAARRDRRPTSPGEDVVAVAVAVAVAVTALAVAGG